MGEEKKDNWFDDNVIWKVGLNTKIKLWEDKWIRETPLYDLKTKIGRKKK